MVKYPAFCPSVSAKVQLAEAPSRRIWRVIVEPDCCFHSHTRLTKRSRPRSWRVLPSDSSWRSTTICVAIPAWSAPTTPDQGVHECLLERVPHVQGAGDVRLGQLDTVRRLLRIGRMPEITARLP